MKNRTGSYVQIEQDLNHRTARRRSNSPARSANEKTLMNLCAAELVSGTTAPLACGHQAKTPVEKRLPSGILFFGPPGCGKGTVGNAIRKLPGFIHCSSGDIIRSAMSKEGSRRDSWSAMANGALIDDGVLWELFDSFLSSLKNSEQAETPPPLVIVDGIPRCRSQVHELRKRMDVWGVLYLECLDAQVLMNRLLRRSAIESRADDASRVTLENRVRLFEEETLPLLDEYHPDIVHRINADQTPANVLSDVFPTLHNLQEELEVRKHPSPRAITQCAFYQGGADW
jgi:adenylate kinase